MIFEVTVDICSLIVEDVVNIQVRLVGYNWFEGNNHSWLEGISCWCDTNAEYMVLKET